MKIKDILKSNLTKYIIILIIGLIITFPAIIPSYNLDGYCTISSGYNEYAIWFLKSARFFSSLLFCLASFLKIPHYVFSIISLIGSNIFNALAVYKLSNYIIDKTNNKNILRNILITICSFLIFYNPIVLELFIFEESIIMFLGIFFVVLSVIRLCENNKKDILFSSFYLILAISCYQGVVCYYLPILLLLLVVNQYDFKKILKKMISGGGNIWYKFNYFLYFS